MARASASRMPLFALVTAVFCLLLAAPASAQVAADPTDPALEPLPVAEPAPEPVAEPRSGADA